MRIRAALILGIALLPAPALAKERSYCPDRPGIGTPPCTMEPGKVSVELGIGDWTLSKDATEREDVFNAADLLVRYGVADHAEVQIGWTALGFARTRDKATGEIEHRSGTGDVTLAVRRNLLSPDGSKLSIAVMPYATLPVGREPFGAGDWGAGMMVPLSYEITDKLSFVSTSEVDAAVDEDGHGRHLAYSEAAGAALKLRKNVTATAEYQILADRDPQGHHVEHLSGLSVNWRPAPHLRLDVGANAGLDSDANDMEVYFGISRRF